MYIQYFGNYLRKRASKMSIRITATNKLYIVLESPEGRNKRTWIHGVYSNKAYAKAKAEKLKTGKTKFGKVGYISILTKKIRGEKVIYAKFDTKELKEELLLELTGHVKP